MGLCARMVMGLCARMLGLCARMVMGLRARMWMVLCVLRITIVLCLEDDDGFAYVGWRMIMILCKKEGNDDDGQVCEVERGDDNGVLGVRGRCR